jgi:hypothetical protein
VILERTGSFYMAFLSASVIAVIGALSYLFIVGKVAPIEWEVSGAES